VRSQHFDYLDGWRGLAISLLLIGHFTPVPGINFGAVGVQLFFVLSGLLMSRLLFVQEVPLQTFYRRRITRIFPAAFFFLAVVVAFFIAAAKQISWKETLMATLFINNYFPGEPGKAVMPFGHIWSLSVEEHSYVLLALLAFGARRKIGNATIFTAIASAISMIAMAYYFTQPELGPFRWLRSEVASYGIFLSAFLALFFGHRNVPEMPWFLYPVLVAAGISVHWWSIPVPIQIIFGQGAFALAVNLLFAAPPVIKSVLSLRPLRWLGMLSFSIYLWQQPFYLLVHRNEMRTWIALPLALLCGIASFYLIEKPARRYLNRQWGNNSGSDLAVPTLSIKLK
jgi:peptidoglycan/LPS O-acetylase OafA/YrhL